MADAARWLYRIVLAAVLLGFRRGRGEPPERHLTASRRAELRVAVLLALAGLCGAAFVASFALGADTQALGVSGGGALALLAAASIDASRNLVPQVRASEERASFAIPGEEDDDQAAEIDRELGSGADGITRRRLLWAAGGTAGVGIGAAALTPLASLGPKPGGALRESPWAAGVRLVDENSLPVFAADLEDGSFITAFAEGADMHELASAVAVVRVPVDELELPAGREDWAPGGLLAYSKICTHAQCAISLYRYPLYQPTSPRPALVCPCHYSAFDVRKGGDRIFGPAVRPLPQLPLRIDDAGHLVAAGPLSGAVGASWSGVREDS